MKEFSGQPEVTDLVALPDEVYGQLKNGEESTATFTIKGTPWNVLSGAMMISCSNDGLVGLDSAKLPVNIGDSVEYMLEGYDSGRGLNTEKSEDIPDLCSIAGLVPVHGKPNGNQDIEVDRISSRPIRFHEGIRGVGDLVLIIIDRRVQWQNSRSRENLRLQFHRMFSYEIDLLN